MVALETLPASVLPLRLGVGLAGVALEQTGRGELAELVAHHVVGDVDGDELVAVVHGDGEPDHLREHGGAAGPRLDHALVHRGLGDLDLLLEVGIAERARHEGPSHD